MCTSTALQISSLVSALITVAIAIACAVYAYRNRKLFRQNLAAQTEWKGMNARAHEIMAVLERNAEEEILQRADTIRRRRDITAPPLPGAAM